VCHQVDRARTQEAININTDPIKYQRPHREHRQHHRGPRPWQNNNKIKLEMNEEIFRFRLIVVNGQDGIEASIS